MATPEPSKPEPDGYLLIMYKELYKAPPNEHRLERIAFKDMHSWDHQGSSFVTIISEDRSQKRFIAISSIHEMVLQYNSKEYQEAYETWKKTHQHKLVTQVDPLGNPYSECTECGSAAWTETLS